MSLEMPVFSRRLLHPRYWLTWLAMGLWWLLSQLPLSVLVAIGGLVGRAMYYVGGSRRRIVERNIELCFPELSADERQALVRKNFISYGIALFEVSLGWWWSDRRLKKVVNLQGAENLTNLDGQGALLMAMHFTTLEVGAQRVNMHTSIDGMYRPHKNPVYDFLQRKGRVRRSADTEVFPRKDVRGVLRALRSGRVVWYAPDQDYGAKQSVFAPFFGIPAATVTATAKFARAGQARVLPYVHYRRDDNSGFEVIIYPPLENFPCDDELADATRINGLIEQFIRRHPDQYLWAHRRFKTRPEGEPPIYRKD